MLDRLDDHLTNLVGVRTRLGAVANSIENNLHHTERDLIIKEEYKSKIEDADVAELYSEMAKQQAILDATYKSSSQLLNNSLLNFLK
jgi:flagellar hook-associated protein 3 FlgL